MRAALSDEDGRLVGDRQPEVDVTPGKDERTRHHADDVVGAAAQGDGAADDSGVAGEGALPQTVAQDHHPRLAVEGLIVGEDAPEEGRRVEDLEQVAGDAQRLQPLRLAVTGQKISLAPLPLKLNCSYAAMSVNTVFWAFQSA